MKKTFKQILEDLLGSKLEEEVDIEMNEDKEKKSEESSNKDVSTEDNKSDDSKLIEDKDGKSGEASNKDKENKSEEDAAESVKEEVVKIFEDGWYDEASGSVNLDKIKNVEVLSAIKFITEKYQAEKEQRMIADSLNDELKNYSLNVSEDTLRKVLDTSGVKIDKDGKVIGVKEALESLKASEPNFFKDKEKESSPLNEGFNPVERQSTLSEDEIIALAYGNAE